MTTEFQFTDTAGRTWTLPRVTRTMRKDIERAVGVNLLALAADEAVRVALFNDRDRLEQILWFLARPAAEAAGLAEDTFFARLDPDAANAAFDALGFVVVDFLFLTPDAKATAFGALRQTLARQSQPPTSTASTANSPASSGSTAAD